MDKLMGTQSVMITLDVDALLFEKLEQIADAGFTMVEINCSKQTLLQQVLQHFPQLRIGAGNIMSTQELENSYNAGVHFATSPGFLPAIAQTAAIYSMNYIPGVATLSEAMHAIASGCQHVRPFPAHLGFCTLLNKCMPMLRLFPAEVEWEEAEHFLNLPSVSAVSILNPGINELKTLSAGVMALS